MSNPRNKTSAVLIALEERQYLALSLRKQGGNYREIAATLRQQEGVSSKYNEAQAYKDVTNALGRLRAEYAEAAEPYRVLELERIDAMFSALWPYAEKGDPACVDRILRLMHQRSRYIPGLYTEESLKGPRGASMSIGLGSANGAPVITEVFIELRGESDAPESEPLAA